MKKYFVMNMLFTMIFLVLFVPLCYLLYDYVLNHGFSPAAAKHSLSDANVAPISVERNFSYLEESADQVTVLMYHQFIPEKQLKKHHYTKTGELVDTVVTVEQFTEQMNFLKEKGYTVLTLKEFELFMTKQKEVPVNSVLITIDDGYKNVIEFAYPILKEHGFNAVFFIVTGLITNRTVAYNSSSLQYASIAEIKMASDVFDYGNHTHALHQRTRSGVPYLESFSEEKIRNDLNKANEWIGNSTSFAAPYGAYNDMTLNILEDLDVRVAFTVKPGYAEPAQHILEVPRQGVYPFYTIEDFEYILEFGGRK